MGAELLLADIQTDARTDIPELIILFLTFANALKMSKVFQHPCVVKHWVKACATNFLCQFHFDLIESIRLLAVVWVSEFLQLCDFIEVYNVLREWNSLSAFTRGCGNCCVPLFSPETARARWIWHWDMKWCFLYTSHSVSALLYLEWASCKEK